MRSSGSAMPAMDDAIHKAIDAALGRIPTGLFVLTAQHEERRMGMVTTLVQQVGIAPPMVCVAVAKGRPIMPLISESHRFGLCQLAETDKIIRRKFAAELDMNDDPFLGFDLLASKLPNLPILANALTFLECELTCHMDVEGDHDLFIGAVRHGGCNGGKPHVILRDAATAG